MTMRIEEAAIGIAYSYDGTLEGLLSAIFAAYAYHEDPQDIAPESQLQLRLGQEERAIQTNFEWAQRVAQGIVRTGGKATFRAVKKASLSSHGSAGTIVYRFVRKLMRERGYLLDQLADPTVGELMRLVKAIDAECERMRQFVRFTHVEQGGWFAICNPRDNVVPLIMDWFAARFNDQPFAIYDGVHHIAGVYENRNWYLINTNSYNAPKHADDESLMQDAWRLFYRTLSIDARYNPELRRTHMPVRYWKNLTEMQQPDSCLDACPKKLEHRSQCQSPTAQRASTASPLRNASLPANDKQQLRISRGIRHAEQHPE